MAGSQRRSWRRETPRVAESVETAEQRRTTGHRCAIGLSLRQAAVKVPRNVPLL